MDLTTLRTADVGVTWAAEHRWEPGEGVYGHGVTEYGLWCVLSGEVVVTLAAGEEAVPRPIRVPRGAALLLPAGVLRDVETPDGAHWLSVGLRATLFGRLDLLRALEPPRQWTPGPEEFATVTGWMRQITDAWTAVALPRREETQTEYRLPLARIPHMRPRDPVAEWIGIGLATSLVAVLWREWGGGGGGADARGADGGNPSASAAARLDAPEWLTRALDRARRDPGVDVGALAREAGLSEAQFRRVFHAWVGVSPRAYLTRVRLEEARRLLLGTDLPVAEVAARVGFESPFHFTRLFRQHFDAPPARWRHQARTPDL